MLNEKEYYELTCNIQNNHLPLDLRGFKRFSRTFGNKRVKAKFLELLYNTMTDIVESYRIDFLTDIYRINDISNCDQFIWIVRDNGTDIAPLRPHNRDWAITVVSYFETYGVRYYLIDAANETVKQLTYNQAISLARKIPEPVYYSNESRTSYGQVYQHKLYHPDFKTAYWYFEQYSRLKAVVVYEETWGEEVASARNQESGAR